MSTPNSVSPPWSVFLAGERPDDLSPEPLGSCPPATVPQPRVLGSHNCGTAVAAARGQPWNAPAYLRRGRRLPGRATPAVGARSTGPREHAASPGLCALDRPRRLPVAAGTAVSGYARRRDRTRRRSTPAG